MFLNPIIAVILLLLLLLPTSYSSQSSLSSSSSSSSSSASSSSSFSSPTSYHCSYHLLPIRNYRLRVSEVCDDNDGDDDDDYDDEDEDEGDDRGDPFSKVATPCHGNATRNAGSSGWESFVSFRVPGSSLMSQFHS